MALPTGLLEAVRNYLDITWVDVAGDEKLSGIIARGIKYIDGIAGSTMDYTLEDKPKELLLDYCLYARSNALNEFQNNYKHELLCLQLTQEVAVYTARASLSILAISDLILTPTFDPTIKTYTTDTVNTEDAITAILTDDSANIKITVNGSETSIATWIEGINKVVITVTYNELVVVYTLAVTKGVA